MTGDDCWGKSGWVVGVGVVVTVGGGGELTGFVNRHSNESFKLPLCDSNFMPHPLM